MKWAGLWFLSEVESGSPSPHLFVCHPELNSIDQRQLSLVLQPTTEAAKKPWLASFTNRQYLFLITQLYFSPPDSHYLVCGVAKPVLQVFQYLEYFWFTVFVSH